MPFARTTRANFYASVGATRVCIFDSYMKSIRFENRCVNSHAIISIANQSCYVKNKIALQARDKISSRYNFYLSLIMKKNAFILVN